MYASFEKEISDWYFRRGNYSPKDYMWFGFKYGDVTVSRREDGVLALMVIKVKKEFRGQGHFKAIINILEKIAGLKFEIWNIVNPIVEKFLQTRGYSSYEHMGGINFRIT